MVAVQLEKLDALRRQIRSAMMYPALVFGFAGDRDARRRRLHRPDLRRHLRGARRRAPARSAELPLMTQITVGASDLITGSWFIVLPVLIALLGRVLPVEEDRARAATSGTSFKLQAAVQDRRRRPEGRDRALVAGLLRHDRRRRPDPAGGQDRRRDRRATRSSPRRWRTSTRRSAAAARSPARSSAPTSSRRWSPTWSRSARRPASSSTCSAKVADFYEAEVDAKVKALTSLIEPIMIMLRRRRRRLHRDLDVPADLQPLRQDPLARPSLLELRDELGEEVAAGDHGVDAAAGRDRDDQHAVVEEDLGELRVRVLVLDDARGRWSGTRGSSS